MFEHVNSDYQLRLYRLKCHDIVAFTNLPLQMEYTRQSSIMTGDLLYVLQDQPQVYHSSLSEKQVDHNHFLRITRVVYKNWFKRILKRFFKEPIQYVKAEFIS